MKKLTNKEPTELNILFIARTYPPLIGGMERFAHDFYRYMNKLANVTLIANPKGKRNVPFFFFKVLFYLIFNAHRYDLIHFNDAILAPTIPVIHFFSNAKITFTVHGLDVVYQKYGYQYLVIPFLRHADQIFPVSRYTKQQCLRRNIPSEKLTIIPNGLDFSTPHPCKAEVQRSIDELTKTKLQGKIILLTLGRLIPRKGHAWFIKNVFTQLPGNYVYLIAGAGQETENLIEIREKYSLDDRVLLLGYVTEEEKACLFQNADLFIMPNISDENDQEGFGIVLLEAGIYNLPSIASNIEGIRDAVIDGVSGKLIPEGDVDAFIKAIKHPSFNRGQISKKLRNKFDWNTISKLYLEAFQSITERI